MINLAPLTEEEARVCAALRIACCDPMSGVLRAVLTKAQAAALYDDLTGFPVQICGVPMDDGVTVLLWLPTHDIDLMIVVLRRMFRYTASVQKLFARECPEYPGKVWLVGRALLHWLLKGTSQNDNATTTPRELLPRNMGRETADPTPLPMLLRQAESRDHAQRWQGDVSGVRRDHIL